MPLHGKIVVLKRSGGDGTEFPLTATCLFGRKPDCDIRIQLPQVSKEHCRVDLNENKEVIVTNLSSVNPTCVNGQALQQSERLKHGDVITIIDRSFRFEYPPPPTPKKRSSVGGKVEAATVDPHLKDGANTDNIQRSQEKVQEVVSKEDATLSENKPVSPFGDLYQMIKQSLDVKTPRKSSVSVLQTPSKFDTPNPESARKKQATPARVQTPIPPAEKAEDASVLVTPQSSKRRSVQLSAELNASNIEEVGSSETPPRRAATPQKFSLSEAVEQIVSQSPKSPRRRSKETTSPVSAKRQAATPKSSEKEKSKARKSSEFASDLSTQELKRKRVSFGGHLSPELFDKRLPPDSPLRKGATPRRSLSLYKPKQSLLRRASVGGLLLECEQERHFLQSPKTKSPKVKTPSPKKTPKAASPKTPPSAKRSPKTQSPKSQTTPKSVSPKSPKTATLKAKSPSPAKKAATPKKTLPSSPKAKSPSPAKKAATPKKTSPKSPKPQSPVQKVQSPKAPTPKSKSPSPGKGAVTPKKASPRAPSPKTTPAKSVIQPKTPKPQRKSVSSDATPKGRSPGRSVTPKNSPVQTPKVQGRFSVSLINTPSPAAKGEASVERPQAATPKIPLKRKSMKSATKTTPALKSATKVMRRKSGVMRSSMKVITSWADIVRFGKAKAQVGVPNRAQVLKKTVKQKKKAGPKPQTPKRRLVDQVSTGHAASPATIVVGRAHRLRMAHPAGAPPKVVTNTAVLRKNMKMDEDLTGLSEMFTTPKNEKRRSTKTAFKTPQTDLSKSIMEPSVLNTPEETGEMVVSPMSVASAVKGRRYNSEAVQRLLSEEESFASETPSLEMSETSEQVPEIKEKTPKTPKEKIPKPEGLTGVKRMMQTPKQKAEPIEDLRGKLFKTPKQKSEPQECLSAVKHIMRTPKVKAAPVEDLRGKLLKTPKQKTSQPEECLTGVKRIMKTPKEKSQPLEDLRGGLLKTPKQKTEQQECFSAVKMLLKTPDQKVEETENTTGAARMTTPKQTTEQEQECLTGVKRIVKTQKERSEPIKDIKGKLLKTPKQKIEQQECLTGVKRIMTTPKQKNEPVEDMVGVKRLIKTPKERVQPVEHSFGIKRLMRSPRLRGTAPVEDFEGLEELMKEPAYEPVGDKEEFVTYEQQETISEQVEKVPETEVVDQTDGISISPHEETEKSDVVESLQRETTLKAKSVRGRRAKVAEPSQSEKAQALVRPKRGRKAETSTPLMTLPDEVQGMNAESTVEHIKPTSDQEMEQITAPAKPVVKNQQDQKIKADETVSVKTSEKVDADMDVDQLETTSVCPAEGTEISCVVVESVKEKVAPKTKSVRGRRAKTVEPIDENKQAQPAETKAPLRARRKQKVEISAPDQTEHKTSKTLEEPVQAEVAPLPPVKQRRGRTTTKSSMEQPEITQPESNDLPAESQTENEHVQLNDQEVEQSTASQEPVAKYRRNRKNKADDTVPEQTFIDNNDMNVGQPETSSLCPADKSECVEVESVQEVAPKTKSNQGRRAKTVEPLNESKRAQPEETEAPVRAKRGRRANTLEEPKQAESALQPPVKDRRGRVVKKSSVEMPEEVKGVSTDSTAEPQTRPEHAQATCDQEVEQPPASEEPVVKRRRGRKNNAEGSCDVLTTEQTAKEKKPSTPVDFLDNLSETQKKVSRGRNLKPTTEQEPLPAPTEDTASEETVAPVRGRRGKKTEALPAPVVKQIRVRAGKALKMAEVSSEKTQQINETSCEEAGDQDMTQDKNMRGRKNKTSVEPEPEIIVVEVKSDDTQPELSLPKMKPQRGRRTKVQAEPPQPETEILVEEDPALVSKAVVDVKTEKKIKGRRGKPEAEPPAVKTLPEEVVPAEKSKRLKRVRATEDNNCPAMPLAPVPEKKSRTSKQDSKGKSVSIEPACELTEPVKRARRAAKTASDNEIKTNDEDKSHEESSDGTKDTQGSKKSVKWNSFVEVKYVTPLKNCTWQKNKNRCENIVSESKEPQDDLKDKTQPAKRARRRVKAAEETTNTTQANVCEFDLCSP